MAMTRSGHRSVVGVYPDLSTAEKAITTLEAHGFDGDDVHLFGDAADRADTIDVSTRDAKVANRVGGSSIVGAAAGAVIGAVVGLIVGALIGGNLWWVFGVIGAIAVGAYGSVVGAFSRMRASDDWDLAFEPVPGEAAVAVRSTDGAKLDEAADALRGAGATRVELH
jgi:outer membrane lipoprotein SlyB